MINLADRVLYVYFDYSLAYWQNGGYRMHNSYLLFLLFLKQLSRIAVWLVCFSEFPWLLLVRCSSKGKCYQ